MVTHFHHPLCSQTQSAVADPLPGRVRGRGMKMSSPKLFCLMECDEVVYEKRDGVAGVQFREDGEEG